MPMMVMAGYHVLNNECVPNNEVICISSYHSNICGEHVNATVNVRET